MDTALTFDDVCLKPVYNNINSRTETHTKTWLTKKIQIDIPIIAANMDTVINSDLADILLKRGSLPIFHRFTTFEKQIEWVKNYKGQCFISCGLNKEHLEHVFNCIKLGANVNIDVAHGHCSRMVDYIKIIKDKYPDTQIIAGNVCTPEGVHDLVIAGADAIRVGIGCGAACTTRMVTGFGIPQFSAIQECAKIANKLRVPIISDGGIRNSRDIMIALGAGASVVMIGGLFSKTEESGSEKEIIDGVKYVKYRGSASRDFQEDFYGKVKDKTVPEGISFKTECTGSANNLLDELLGGIRSGLTYGGSRTIKELHRKAEFVRVSSTYMNESKPRKNIIN